MKTNCTLSFAFHIHDILGATEFRRVKDGYSHKSLQKTLLKNIKAIKHAAEENLKVIDATHLRHIKCCIDDAEKKIKRTESENELFEVFASFQGKLIFLLIGEAPKRKENFTNRRENWKLDRHRSLIYTQNEQQKANLLNSYIQNYLVGEGRIFESLIDYFTFEYSPTRTKETKPFLDWMKTEHFSEYETLMTDMA